jgi:hypothetical protein
MPTPAHSFLTPPRIRLQAAVLAVALWVGYFAILVTPGMRDRFGQLKGADFLHAYILGTIALDHHGDALYDAKAQRAIGEQRVPDSNGDYFLPVYGPQYSLLWMPFAALPYPWAAALWECLSALVYAACCYAIWRTCPNLRPHGVTVPLAAAAFPGFFSLITFGQNSSLALAAFTLAYFALRSRRYLLAGFSLGLLAYKPQLAIVPACLLVTIFFRPAADSHVEGDAGRLAGVGTTRLAILKLILGATLSVLAQFAIAWIWYGSAPFIAYAHVLTHLTSMTKILEPRIYLMHSFRAFWDLLLPWTTASFTLYLLTAIPTIFLAISCWRRPAPLEHRFAVMLLATVLVAPHLTVYDLVILAPAFLWISDWLATHASRRIAWLLYLAFLLPFAGPLARSTHLQVSVISMAALLIAFAQEFRHTLVSGPASKLSR